jgi:hypothetical protein
LFKIVRGNSPVNSEEFEILRKKIVELTAQMEEYRRLEASHYKEFCSLQGKFYKTKEPESEPTPLNTSFSPFS